MLTIRISDVRILLSVGRILSRLSKDQDTLDNELAGTLNQVCSLAIGDKVECSQIVRSFWYRSVLSLALSA